MSKQRAVDFDRHFYLATAARGTEPALEAELRELGVADLREVPGGIEFRGSIEQAMRVCLWSRIANRVLLELGRDRITNERQIYPSVRSLPLDGWFSPDHTLAVSVQTRGEQIPNSMFAALVVKDAVVDHVRDATGQRPNVDRDQPDTRIVLIHIEGDIRYYIELNGQPLNQRGYRVRDVRAPLKETMAAALIRFSRWNGRSAFVDPMCGSGTIVIEAAMIAADMAPGMLRPMAFERWPFFVERLQRAWTELRDEAAQRKRPKVRGILGGGDADMAAVAAARANAAVLGVDGLVFHQRDATRLEPVLGGATLVCNPPYGERVGGEKADVDDLMRNFSSAWRRLQGHPLTMIAPDAAIRAFGVKPARQVRVSNGKIPCKFVHFPGDARVAPT